MLDFDIKINFDKLEEAGKLAKKGLKDGIKLVGFKIEQEAKKNVVNVDAIDTGAMQNSIYVQFDGRQAEREQAVAAYEAHAATDGKKSGKPHAAPVADQEWIANGMTVKVGYVAEYAELVEYGTERMDARPFLNPAVETGKAAAPELAAKAVELALKGLL